MDETLGPLVQSFIGYARWVWGQIVTVSPYSYFWLLVGVSLVAAVLEVVRPWRRDQPLLRRDFFVDLFYVFFNMFGFGLLGYAALSDVTASIASDLLRWLGLPRLGPVDVRGLPHAAQLALYLVARDLVEYFIHRLLHRVPFLWRFHEVHHSVREMGFAAHLRFHPLETVVYRTLEFLPMAMLGFAVRDFFVAHAIALTVGHLNHSNFRLPMGPLRYLLNSAEMHLLHHAKDGPRPFGVNFGLTLSLWDWVFGTAWLPPGDRRHTELGFPGVERYPRSFLGHLVAPFRAPRVTPRAQEEAAS